MIDKIKLFRLAVLQLIDYLKVTHCPALEQQENLLKRLNQLRICEGTGQATLSVLFLGLLNLHNYAGEFFRSYHRNDDNPVHEKNLMFYYSRLLSQIETCMVMASGLHNISKYDEIVFRWNGYSCDGKFIELTTRGFVKVSYNGQIFEIPNFYFYKK